VVSLARHCWAVSTISFRDRRRNSTILLGDRLGVTPLYYSSTRGRLLFGAEMTSVLRAVRIGTSFDQQGLVEHLWYGALHAHGAFYRGVRSLRRRHWLVAGAEIVRNQQWWALEGWLADGEAEESTASSAPSGGGPATRRPASHRLRRGAFVPSPSAVPCPLTRSCSPHARAGRGRATSSTASAALAPSCSARLGARGTRLRPSSSGAEPPSSLGSTASGARTGRGRPYPLPSGNRRARPATALRPPSSLRPGPPTETARSHAARVSPGRLRTIGRELGGSGRPLREVRHPHALNGVILAKERFSHEEAVDQMVSLVELILDRRCAEIP
jgi:hypothetical protein